MTSHRHATPPDGIREENIRPAEGWWPHASPLPMFVFGAVVVLGLAGLLGRERDFRAEGTGVDLTVHSPEIIRNGEFFEMRVLVESPEPIDELVIGVGEGLWEDITVNTMIPAASEEEHADGEFRFTFPRLEANARFQFKVDVQVNPDILGGNEGSVTVYDGERALATVDVNIVVLP